MTDTDTSSALPQVIQGGMGVAISSWRLARKVARRGQLGVVSGVALDRLLFVRLQHGDEGGHLRRACDAFPDRAMADRVYARWHRPDGLPEPGRYEPLAMHSMRPKRELLELAVVGAFCEVYLGKEGHDGAVGINMLEKIQAPTLPILYGALLAGVDYVLMGAGIPREIPGHIAALCAHRPATLAIALDGGGSEGLPFDPAIVEHALGPLPRPHFLAIVSTHVLAMALARVDGVDGFIVEHHSAGGHNAPPRGWSAARDGEPAYGERDAPDFDRIKRLGKPFWIAGGQDGADALATAREMGAAGIQVGTAFAFCSDSGMADDLRRRALRAAADGELTTVTEGRGSPTGFPFKVLDLADTAGARDPDTRSRQPCQLGYLRTAYRREDGSVGWRCAAEPEAAYLAKGGHAEDLPGRRCICNGLLATIGLGYTRNDGSVEEPLVTAGDLRDLGRFMRDGADDYDADAVLDVLLGSVPARPSAP